MWRAICAFVAISACTAQVSHVWVADLGDGNYKNPILHADYSDPDVIRAGDDFYMTASSFNAVPGLPILHSRDLVNWELIGHALAAEPPLDVYSKPQHGGGVWAPSLRQHNGEFYIFYPDPDYGIYMTKAKNPAGPWSAPVLVKQAKGWIDPCPLWDDDGNAYLVSAVAASRSGQKSILLVSRMDPDGTRLLGDGVLVFDGHAQDPTVEGPKLYKRNGYYYIAAPAGGVPQGWQLVLRSKNIYGPYERKIVLSQGKTAINGPHQGGWIDTPGGQFWFVHFQDKGPYGRVVHLEPMEWMDDWPVIGDEGHPVSKHKKPDVGRNYPVQTPADSDEFNEPRIGLQWQWQANPQPGWAFPFPALGALRLYAIPSPATYRNLWDIPNLLLQKFPAPAFTATAKVTFTPRADQDRVGLVVMGTDYAYLGVRRAKGGIFFSQAIAMGADQGAPEKESTPVPLTATTFYLRVSVAADAVCRFAFSLDGNNFVPVGDPFTARAGKWIGARVGIFALGSAPAPEYGYTDFDWFRVE
jgi:beta-xylosidase